MELKWYEHLKPFSSLYEAAAEILVVYLQILENSAIELDQILLFTLPYPGSIHVLAVVVWEQLWVCEVWDYSQYTHNQSYG